MSDPNENRPGFKETKVGWIPEEWDVTPLVDLVQKNRSIRYGIVQPGDFDPNGRFMIRGQDYSRGWADSAELFRVSAEVEKRYRNARVSTGDLIMTIVGAGTGTVTSVPDWLDGANLTQTTARISIDSSKLVPGFCQASLQSFIGQRQVAKGIKGGAQPGLNCGDLEHFLIPHPRRSVEQELVANILFTCDEVIEKTGALIEAKRRQKKALMQQLLTGKKRLPGFEGKWVDVTLEDISIRLREVADKPDGYPVLSITAGTGFVSQEDKFSRVIAGKQVEHYVLLRRGEFAYNKGNSFRYPQGCVYQLSEYEEGLVPNVFYSFKLDEKQASPEFIKQYFLAGLHNKDLYRWINSGVRNNGLLNLNSSDFFKLPISLPPLPEQGAVGEVLRDADSEIKGLGEKVCALKRQKKALMQKLLTGHVRVKV